MYPRTFWVTSSTPCVSLPAPVASATANESATERVDAEGEQRADPVVARHVSGETATESAPIAPSTPAWALVIGPPMNAVDVRLRQVVAVLVRASARTRC